jgi:hypothetical protein
VSCAPTSAVCQAELKTPQGRSQRAKLREALRKDTARLAHLETISPMQAANMNSECLYPSLAAPRPGPAMSNIGPDSQAARIRVSDMMPSSAGQASRLLSVTAATSSTATA